MSFCKSVCNGDFAQNHPKFVRSVEAVTAITTLALAAIATASFMHLGVFAQHAQLSLYIGIGTAVGGGLLSAGLISYIIYSCKHHSTSEQTKQPISTYDERKYSPNRPADEKLAFQLDMALKEGLKNSKKHSEHQWGLELENDKNARSFIDFSIELTHVGAAETQGERGIMEDAHVACSLIIGGQKAFLYGVFDGHYQGDVAKYVRDKLPEKLKEKLNYAELTDEAITDAITGICIDLEEETQEIRQVDSVKEGGTTVLFALQVAGRVYTANVGDSRAVLIKKDDGPYQLSEDAQPLNPRFKRGVEKMGYKVMDSPILAGYYNLVDGVFAVARDIGETTLSPRPKITRIDSDFSEGDYLVLACDGLWDEATNQEIYDSIQQMSTQGTDVMTMAGHLVQGALASGSTDNVTVLVVKLNESE